MLAAITIALAFAPLPHLAPSTPARAVAPVMSEAQTRRGALLGLAALTIPGAANAVSAVPIWKASKKGLGYKKGQPEGAKKCNVAKPCNTGAGLKWDAAALGVKKAEKRKFFKTETYANSQY